MEVHGLTTAAAVWVTAALCVACAIASWHLVFLALATTIALLVTIVPLERLVESRAAPAPVRAKPLDDADDDPPR
ncbi:hypothetical protein [Ancylobacter sp.]|uniref:hypothetical protein n=1 Tax=Ancylobacter sp. TaxID=1872567 RepID=UPI003D0EB035